MHVFLHSDSYNSPSNLVLCTLKSFSEHLCACKHSVAVQLLCFIVRSLSFSLYFSFLFIEVSRVLWSQFAPCGTKVIARGRISFSYFCSLVFQNYFHCARYDICTFSFLPVGLLIFTVCHYVMSGHLGKKERHIICRNHRKLVASS
jgi:hypothetical protein